MNILDFLIRKWSAKSHDTAEVGEVTSPKCTVNHMIKIKETLEIIKWITGTNLVVDGGLSAGDF